MFSRHGFFGKSSLSGSLSSFFNAVNELWVCVHVCVHVHVCVCVCVSECVFTHRRVWRRGGVSAIYPEAVHLHVYTAMKLEHLNVW